MKTKDWLEHLQREAEQEAKTSQSLVHLQEEAERKRTVVSMIDHMQRARKVRDACRPHLRYWRGDFYDWINTSHYQEIGKDATTAEVWKFLATTFTPDRDNKLKPFLPNSKLVNETIAALKAIVDLNEHNETPFWIDGRRGGGGDDLIVFPNGLLELDSGKLRPSDPNFFTLGALAFDYQPAGEEPKAWLQFLDEIFAGEQAQINQLQETFGYLLSNDVAQEKGFLLLGPERSGKGTLFNMVRALLASTAITGPSLKSLATNFGLSSLIGKQVALIDDLRVERKSEVAMVENMLKITGRGFFTFDRKYKSHWSGRLPVKLMLTSNVMPRFGDDSPALANRFIISVTKQSFLGREDPNLFEQRLKPERLGVLHWAMAGLRRLRQRGHFLETQQSGRMRARMAQGGSLVQAFVADKCVLDPEAWVLKDVIYARFKSYATGNDSRAGTKENFCEALYAATSGKVRPGRLRVDGERVHVCYSIRLK